MFVCLGERQNTPKNFLLLEISLKRLSGLGTCRKVYTRVWQVHQSLFAASAFPAWNAARLQQSPAAISSAGAHAMEPTCSFLGSPFVQPLLETHGQGLSLCSISCSKPRDLRLAADTGISTLVETDTAVSIEFPEEKYTKQAWVLYWFSGTCSSVRNSRIVPDLGHKNAR